MKGLHQELSKMASVLPTETLSGSSRSLPPLRDEPKGRLRRRLNSYKQSQRKVEFHKIIKSNGSKVC